MTGHVPKDWKARLTAHIRDGNGRITGPRMRVAEVFFSMEGHPGVEQLAAEVRRRHKGIGYATVYRTMKLLVESGLVAAREFGEGFARYEVQEPAEHHDHLICTSCGRILEFEDPGIEDLQERVTRAHGFVMQRHRLEIYGLCPTCRAGTSAAAKPRVRKA
jgi:Fur family ferric uptake transcriptional regulator